MGWFGSIFSARESKSGESPSEGYDGNYTYSNGTYGQSDYTVRERSDGTFDVYIASDSSRGHSHHRIDKDGNILETYHDYLFIELSQFSNDELKEIASLTNNETVAYIANSLIDNEILTLKK